MVCHRKGSLNELDLAILEHLEKDGRKSFTAIAKDCGVSVQTVSNRVSKMIAARTLNIIARVNPFRAGLEAYAIVHIDIKPGALLNEAINEILQFPEVSFLATCVGEYDIVIDVMCRDNDHLRSVVLDRLYKVPGVVDVKTTTYLDVYQWFQPNLRMLRARPEILD